MYSLLVSSVFPLPAALYPEGTAFLSGATLNFTHSELQLHLHSGQGYRKFQRRMYSCSSPLKVRCQCMQGCVVNHAWKRRLVANLSQSLNWIEKEITLNCRYRLQNTQSLVSKSKTMWAGMRKREYPKTWDCFSEPCYWFELRRTVFSAKI